MLLDFPKRHSIIIQIHAKCYFLLMIFHLVKTIVNRKSLPPSSYIQIFEHYPLYPVFLIPLLIILLELQKIQETFLYFCAIISLDFICLATIGIWGVLRNPLNYFN